MAAAWSGLDPVASLFREVFEGVSSFSLFLVVVPLGAVLDGGSGADVGLETVETKGDYLDFVHVLVSKRMGLLFLCKFG